MACFGSCAKLLHSCSARSPWSSSWPTGGCSGSPSGRAGRHPLTRSRRRVLRLRRRRSWHKAGHARTTRRCRSRGRPRRRSSRGRRASTSSRGSSPTWRLPKSTVHILMFGWREGEVGKRMAALLEAETGRGRRGEGDRGRVRLQAVQASAGDVHGPRYRRSPDRRQRRLPARPGRPLPRRPAVRLETGRDRPSRSPQALRDRRRNRLDRRRGDRGPLRERRFPRRDGSGHRRCRSPGAGGLFDELPRPRWAASVRALVALPGAGRSRPDADRARAGDSRRARRRVSGDRGADRLSPTSASI